MPSAATTQANDAVVLTAILIRFLSSSVFTDDLYRNLVDPATACSVRPYTGGARVGVRGGLRWGVKALRMRYGAVLDLAIPRPFISLPIVASAAPISGDLRLPMMSAGIPCYPGRS